MSIFAVLRPAICLSVLGMLSMSAVAGSDYFPPPDASGGWRALVSPAEVRRAAGMDSARLDAAFAYAQRTSQHGGLLVVRHGWLAYEKYYGKGSRETTPAMASVGKAYASIAC